MKIEKLKKKYNPGIIRSNSINPIYLDEVEEINFKFSALLDDAVHVSIEKCVNLKRISFHIQDLKEISLYNITDIIDKKIEVLIDITTENNYIEIYKLEISDIDLGFFKNLYTKQRKKYLKEKKENLERELNLIKEQIKKL